jgi:hypothetical protein
MRMNHRTLKIYRHKTQRVVEYIVTRNMYYFAALSRYTAVKYTDIYFVSF